MIELVTSGGKKIGQLSDEVGGTDELIVKGKRIDLEDVYSSEELTDKYNTQAKELKDESSDNEDPAGTSE